MSVSADMYIVISLMFAVFAAVAAVGSSMVLGIGFERLRSGFEIVKKQTGFFADAIHQLDQRADVLDKQQGEMKEAVSSMHNRVEKVEKQTDFFFSSLTSLESQILEGQPAQVEPIKEELPVEPKEKTLSANVVQWTATSETKDLLNAQNTEPQANQSDVEPKTSHGISSMIFDYLKNDNGGDGEQRVYH